MFGSTEQLENLLIEMSNHKFLEVLELDKVWCDTNTMKVTTTGVSPSIMYCLVSQLSAYIIHFHFPYLFLLFFLLAWLFAYLSH